MALSKTTQDHNEIRQWAESRGAIPAEVASTETASQTGILRLEFPKAKNANDGALREISWEEFFEKFDASGLALIYQEQTAEGEQSNFNKLIYPEHAKAQPAAKSSGRKTSAGKSAPAKGKTAAKKSAVSKTPAKSSTAKSIKKAPAQKAASKKAPSGKVSAKKVPTKKAPAKKLPAKKSADKKTSSKSSKRS